MHTVTQPGGQENQPLNYAPCHRAHMLSVTHCVVVVPNLACPSLSDCEEERRRIKGGGEGGGGGGKGGGGGGGGGKGEEEEEEEEEEEGQ